MAELRVLNDEEMRDALYKTRWEAVTHKRVQYPRTSMNVHSLYINDKMYGYILDKPEDKDWFPIYKGNREYAHSTVVKHSIGEAKQALLEMAISGMELPSKRGAITQAQYQADLKAFVDMAEEYVCKECSTPHFVTLVIPLNKWQSLKQLVEKPDEM